MAKQIAPAAAMSAFNSNRDFDFIHGIKLDLRIICCAEASGAELPYYWFNILLHGTDMSVGKINIRNVARFHVMDRLLLTCDAYNAASSGTIERLGGRLMEISTPPNDYFAYYDGIPPHRIYILTL